MAEKISSLRKVGGALSETILWTNPNPTASTGFVAQSVNLSDNINNYKYIKFVCYWNSTATNESEVIYPMDVFKSMVGGANSCYGSFSYMRSNSHFATRNFRNMDDIKVAFASCLEYYTGVSVSTQDKVLVPYQIIGLK